MHILGHLFFISLNLDAQFIDSINVCAGHNYDNKFILPLDRRKELATVIYTTGGAYQDPKGPPLSFGYGEFDGSNDMFGVPIDPYDPRIGRPMRF